MRRGALVPFARGGADGRTTAVGLEVDRGRLLVAGGATGRLFVLSTRDGRTLRALDGGASGEGETFLNDVAVGRRAAYVTDSVRPVLLRARLGRRAVGPLEPWLDLRGTPFEYEEGFNANGIVAARGGRVLLVVQSNTGELFRIDTRTKAVMEVALDGEPLTNGDGMLLRGRTLYVVRNQQEEIVAVRLSGDLRRGRLLRRITSAALRYPTTIARDGDRLLAVNSQFDRRGSTPELPFDVVAVPRPAARR